MKPRTLGSEGTKTEEEMRSTIFIAGAALCCQGASANSPGLKGLGFPRDARQTVTGGKGAQLAVSGQQPGC